MVVGLSNGSADGESDEDSRALAEASLRWPAARDLLLSVEGPPLSATEVSVLLGKTDRAVEV